VTKCKRCTYLWLPAGVRELPKDGCLYILDLGLCVRCRGYKSRVTKATPGDQLNAQLWGAQFEVVRKSES